MRSGVVSSAAITGVMISSLAVVAAAASSARPGAQLRVFIA
jgi:hypothetical protein